MPYAISGDIIDVTDMSFKFAIDGDPDNTCWIPKSVVEEGDIGIEDGVDLLITSWYYEKNHERFG